MTEGGCKKVSASELSKALQEYIKVIHTLQEEHGSAAASDIAEQLGVRAPSVTSALRKLASQGMVKYQKYQEAKLTKKGREVAIRLDRRHKTLMDFLLLIGVDECVAKTDACEIEHIIHPETIEKLAQYLESIQKS
ncbi:MAG: metal-dependent transcriptional regulator [Candidatus Thorarchaeota archaeon]|nr:MAG: metal-dependent transcriptional regulator [Candidatus Thorarchaeota archaeon]RLI58276.1 MAG: metal-dependent transcriptional regulator [Candidatus Thorarchaeota archaeon]